MKTTESILLIVVAYLMWVMFHRPATVVKEKVVAQPVYVNSWGGGWGGGWGRGRGRGRGWGRGGRGHHGGRRGLVVV